MNTSLIISKLKEAYNYKTNAQIARKLGITPARLSMWIQRNTIDNNILLSSFPEISADWLLTGDGEMLKGEAGVQKEEEKEKGNIKYFYEMAATAGNVEDLADNEKNQKFKYLNFPGYDGCVAFNVQGSSMEPLIHSGDIVILDDREAEFIINGEIYLIVTRDGQRTIKRIVEDDADEEGEKQFLCISENPDKKIFKDFKIKGSQIVAIRKVRAYFAPLS